MSTVDWMAPVSARTIVDGKPLWLGGIARLPLRVVDDAAARVVIRHNDQSHHSVAYRAFEGGLWGEIKRPRSPESMPLSDMNVSIPDGQECVVEDGEFLNTVLDDNWYYVYRSASVELRRDAEQSAEWRAAEAVLRRRSADLIVIDGTVWRRCHGPILFAYGLGSSQPNGSSLELLSFFDRPTGTQARSSFSALAAPDVFRGLGELHPEVVPYGDVGVEIISEDGWSRGIEIEQATRQTLAALIATMLDQCAGQKLGEMSTDTIRLQARARMLLEHGGESVALLEMARCLRDVFICVTSASRLRSAHPHCVSPQTLRGWDAIMAASDACLSNALGMAEDLSTFSV